MKKKHTIIFLLHIPPPIHGSAVIGQTIVKSKLINNTYNCSFINIGTSKTVDEIGKKSLSKITNYFKIVYYIIKYIIINKPDLCYFAINSQGLGFYKDSLIALFVKMFGIDLVFHFHNKGVSKRQNRIIDNFLYQLVFKNSHAILLSIYLYSDIEKYFSPSKINICPNGISEVNYINEKLSNKTEIIDSKNNHTLNRPVEILFLSNLIESKGVFVLIEAFNILKNKRLNFHCTFVGGEGSLTWQNIEQTLLLMELTQYVEYVGKKFGKDKQDFFTKSEIFVHPTYEDCFPLVLLEAMQNNLPIVSTYEGGILDIVEDGKTGFLVHKKDAKSLAEKLEVLILNQSLRKQMGNAGRTKFNNEFTLDRFETRLKTILEEILNEEHN